eukprot:5902084-Pyramimonas_sp.AAC.2
MMNPPYQSGVLSTRQLQADARRVLESLGCDMNARIRDLSGESGPNVDCCLSCKWCGQRRRAALASSILSNPDLLILDRASRLGVIPRLDVFTHPTPPLSLLFSTYSHPCISFQQEPTNHMDVGTIQWMEKYLSSPDLTLVLVTHDRAFMEGLCTRLLELDYGAGYMHTFGGKGSYAKMREMRAERIAQQMHEVNAANNKLRKESVWMSRNPKARSTKSRARIDAFYNLKEVAASGPKADHKAQFGTSMARLGTKVMLLEECAVTTDADRGPIFTDLTYEFAPGDRIGVVGPNGEYLVILLVTPVHGLCAILVTLITIMPGRWAGAGKSTLLQMLAARLPLAHGSRDVGETIKFGFLEQEPPEVPEDVKMLEYISKYVDTTTAEGERVTCMTAYPFLLRSWIPE